MRESKYDVFLSHASRDKPIVEELARLLSAQGFRVWLDKWSLVPGEHWQEALEQGLLDSSVCAVCLGQGGLGPWQNEEIRSAIYKRVAEDHSFRVVPVLLPGAQDAGLPKLPPFLSRYTWVVFRDSLNDESAIYRLSCGIRGVEPGPDPASAVAKEANPYRGLEIFDVDDALFFHGREALTKNLVSALLPARNVPRFFAVIGPSGSGKSSLVRAGLLASLKQGMIPDSEAWPIVICKPGERPLENLAVALSEVMGIDDPSSLRRLTEDLASDSQMLNLTTRLILRSAPEDRHLLIFVDQFEEVFTLCSEETARKALIENLLYAATNQGGQTVVVITLRADFYGSCSSYPALTSVMPSRQLLVGAMNKEELRRAIERPAQLAGLELGSGLADLLLREMEDQPGYLPLLQHALSQIWQRREGSHLTIEAYREIGGVTGTLERHAEAVYAQFTEVEKAVCQQLLLRLVQPDDQQGATRRRLFLDGLLLDSDAATLRKVINQLTVERLLTTGDEKKPGVELAHEALITGWKRLQEWINGNRNALQVRRRLDEAATEWVAKDHEPSYLYHGARLAQAEEWAASHPKEVDITARDFLAASIARREEVERKELRKTRYLLSLFIVISLFLGLSTIFAYSQRVKSEHRQKVLEAESLVDRSRSLRNPVLGLLLAILAAKQAKSSEDSHLAQFEEAVRERINRVGGVPLPSLGVSAAGISPDRRWLATSGLNGQVMLWDLDKPTISARKVFEHSPLRLLWVSRNGRWLFGINQQGLVTLFDVSGSKKHQIRVNVSNFSPLSDGPFSPNGRWLATSGAKGMTLRDLSSSQPYTPVLTMHGVTVSAFSADSNWMVTSDQNANLLLWDVSGRLPKQITRITLRGKKVMSLIFSGNGEWLHVRLIEPKMLTSIIPLRLKKGGRLEIHPPILCEYSLLSISSPVDVRILSWGIGTKSSCLWEISTGFSGLRPRFANRDIMTATFSLNGSWLATANSEGLLQVERVTDQAGERYLAEGQTNIKFISFNKNGSRLVTHVPGEAPRVWDLETLATGIMSFEPLVRRYPPNRLQAVNGLECQLWYEPEKKRLSIKPTPYTGSSFPLSASEPRPRLFIFSPSGNWLIGRDQNFVRFWVLGKNNATHVLSSRLPYDMDFSKIDFGCRERWVAVNPSRGPLLLYDLRDIKAGPAKVHSSGLGFSAVALHPEEQWLVANDLGRGLRFVSLSKHREGAPLDRSTGNPGFYAGYVTALAVNSGDNRIAIGRLRDSVLLWKEGEDPIALENRSTHLYILRFSCDGRWLVGVGADGIIQSWRYSGRLTDPRPALLRGHTKPILSLHFSHNKLVSHSLDGTIREWELDFDKLLNQACEITGRNLTKTEWRAYMPFWSYVANEPCPASGGAGTM